MSPTTWVFVVVASYIVWVVVDGWKEFRGALKQKAPEATLAKKDKKIERLKVEIERLKAELANKDLAFYEACLEIRRLEQVIAAALGAPVDFRYSKLRTLVLKELHPDRAPPGSADHALRQELFKAIWPKIEAMEAKAAA